MLNALWNYKVARCLARFLNAGGFPAIKEMTVNKKSHAVGGNLVSVSSVARVFHGHLY